MTKYPNQKIAKADVVNRNNRVYSTAVLQAVIQEIKERNDRGMTLFGEYGMTLKQADESKDHFQRRCAEIKFENVSHSISNPRMEAGWLVADIESTNTPYGNRLEEAQLTRPLNFRMRGFAETQERAGAFHITNYSLVTIDAVDDDA